MAKTMHSASSAAYLWAEITENYKTGKTKNKNTNNKLQENVPTSKKINKAKNKDAQSFQHNKVLFKY